MKREVTENDFRKPEFQGKDPSEYEFRDDGLVVRKDRWKTAVHRIRCSLGDNRREFEVDDIVDAVRALVATIPKQGDDDFYLNDTEDN